jgi:hypothetical protein
MGMFDWYEPDPEIACPVCGAILTEWQGKDGPCGLFVWHQGNEIAIDQRVPEQMQVDRTNEDHRLPQEFIIYSDTCSCPTMVKAICKSVDDVWRTTEVITPESAKQFYWETRSEFAKRLDELRKWYDLPRS